MSPNDLIDRASPLVSLPDVCVRVNEMIDDPNHSAEDIGDVITQDTALSARLLRVVNSAFYGFPCKIDNLSRAITVMGTSDLRDLAVMTAACQMFDNIPPQLINMEKFWRYSVTCGVTSRALARQCNVLHPERLFTMGVLHDIGRLLILKECPIEARDVLLMSNGREDLLATAEQEVFGFTHCDVGALLAERWQLPNSIVDTIRYHHRPDQCKRSILENALIHLGATVADILVWEGDLESIDSLANAKAWIVTGLEPTQCIELVRDHSHEIIELYGILIGGERTPSLSKNSIV